MSDDTPTQRFPSADSGDTPTQRLDTGEVQEDLQEEKQKSKGLLIGLVAAGGLLLLAVVVIAFFLLNRGQGDPIVAGTGTPLPSDSASPTPSETPSATPTPTPEPPDEDPPANPPAQTLKIDSFKVSPSTWTCNTSAPVPVPDPQLSFSWSTSNATHVYFAVGSTNDAENNGMGWDNLPTDGSSSDFPGGMEFTFYCPTASQSYTITAEDDNGHKVSKTVTVINNGDTQ
jgi:hypothetical protein